MATYIDNPRRSPRVRILLPAHVVLGNLVWRAETGDFGTGGCLLLPGRDLDERSRVILEVRTEALPEVLTVKGRVVWQAGPRCGVRFLHAPRGLPPQEWFLRLLAARPCLQELAERSPQRLSTDAIAWRRPLGEGTLHLTSDELRVLAHVRRSTPIHAIQLHARLPPHWFVRAFFSLLDKGIIGVRQPRALTSVDVLHLVRT